MKNFFLIFMTLALFACSNKNKLPKGVLPEQKMQEILWDMIKAGEFLNGFVFYKDSVNKIAESKKWHDKIYQIHKTNRKEFEKSYAYYKDHPVIFKEILDSLGKKQATMRPYSSPALNDTVNEVNTLPTRDSLRKPTDTLKRRIMKKKNPFKAV